MRTNNWQTFFDHHAPEYMGNCFTQNTLAEVDFLVEELALPANGRILEIGCGTGRHSVELARRGYRVTGVDLSAGMLAEAAQAAEAAGVNIDFIHADAREYQPEADAFDAAICLCEGAFCLMGQEDDPIGGDLAILRNVARGLKVGRPFLLTVLSAFRSIRNATAEEIAEGRYDPLTLTTTFDMAWHTPEGEQQVTTRERHYVPTEMQLLCRWAGLQVEHIWGGTAGNWGRRPLDLDEMEMMVVARKIAG